MNGYFYCLRDIGKYQVERLKRVSPGTAIAVMSPLAPVALFYCLRDIGKYQVERLKRVSPGTAIAAIRLVSIYFYGSVVDRRA
jgi:hypothetical protein